MFRPTRTRDVPSDSYFIFRLTLRSCVSVAAARAHDKPRSPNGGAPISSSSGASASLSTAYTASVSGPRGEVSPRRLGVCPRRRRVADGGEHPSSLEPPATPRAAPRAIASTIGAATSARASPPPPRAVPR